MEPVILDENLVIIGLDRKKKEDVLFELSQKLEQRDFVQPDFLSHVLEREEKYPTGLPAAVPLALCHTEAQYVIRSAMAVATLHKPVEFHEMGNPDGVVLAEIVFLLALHNPKDQVLWLKRMANLFKNEKALLAIKEASSPNAILDILQATLFAVADDVENSVKM